MSYLVIEIATNKHISTAGARAELADPLPATLRVVNLGRAFDPANERWDATANDVVPLRPPVPSAVVVTYDPVVGPGTPKTVFQVGDEIGIRVEIQNGQQQIVTTFNGQFPIPVMHYDPVLGRFTGTVRRLLLNFVNGVALRTFTGFTASGDYGVDDRVSQLARVPAPYIITVVE
jgi:hypothetical protein